MRENLCFLCNSNDYNIFKKRLPHPWTGRHRFDLYVYCRHCGLVYRRNELTDKEIDTLYKNKSNELERWNNYSKNKLKKNRRTYQQLKGFIGQFKEDTILDVAEIRANDGSLLWLLKNDGYNVSGVEPTEDLVAYSKQRYDVELIDGYVAYDTFPNDSMDLILCLYTVEHFTDPMESLHYINSFLKPSGLFYVEIPHIFERSHKIFGVGHVTLFSRNTIVKMLVKCGFKVKYIDTKGYGGGRNTALRILASREKHTDMGPVSFENKKDPYLRIVMNIYYIFYLKSLLIQSIQRPIKKRSERLLKKILPESAILKLRKIYHKINSPDM